jgi:hypothetical protein
LMCAILTVPELTSCFRSEAHRTLHSINVSSLSSVLIDNVMSLMMRKCLTIVN